MANNRNIFECYRILHHTLQFAGMNFFHLPRQRTKKLQITKVELLILSIHIALHILNITWILIYREDIAILKTLAGQFLILTGFFAPTSLVLYDYYLHSTKLDNYWFILSRLWDFDFVVKYIYLKTKKCF